MLMFNLHATYIYTYLHLHSVPTHTVTQYMPRQNILLKIKSLILRVTATVM